MDDGTSASSSASGTGQSRYVEFAKSLPKTDTQRIQYATLKARGVTAGTWDREESGYRVERA
jgi:carnitine-CoA ligase